MLFVVYYTKDSTKYHFKLCVMQWCCWFIVHHFLELDGAFGGIVKHLSYLSC